MKDKVVQILINIRPEFDFNDDVNFIETGMLDSFDIVTLVTSLDEEFGI
jgi:acyl carrier protein